MILEKPKCLASAAISALKEPDLGLKTQKVNLLAEYWEARTLSLISSKNIQLPDRPGRPDKPQMLPPHKVPRRSIRSQRGMVALLHAIAHIELNAIDLALDIIARFTLEDMPRSFFDGWVMVAKEESKHFNLLQDRLNDFSSYYGCLPAHDGLWESAKRTQHSLLARLAVVPLVLEARGLDISPSLIEKISEIGDHKTANIFRVIYEDEKGHVAVGTKWFRFLCQRHGMDPALTFQKMVTQHFRGPLKPPFNDLARCKSGLTPMFYRNLTAGGH